MKISCVKYVREGEKLPLLYGFAYMDWIAYRFVAYPIPFNLIIKVLRDFYHLLARLYPNKWDRLLRDHWYAGYDRATKQSAEYFLRHEKTIRELRDQSQESKEVGQRLLRMVAMAEK